jgi:hypothetical protein
MNDARLRFLVGLLLAADGHALLTAPSELVRACVVQARVMLGEACLARAA